ncbi:hypothetical protein [Undibacterium griseum]|uniref:Uncharacterized protein n=1 Tax=Undibacterium griseum TaxID=2762295 RepID=A0ABR6YM29_9BURK|nr:hypothetical protein [Undibacterium griseum]MBC3884951.1 hypothetical protein [Undibacterium griseum]
MSGLSSYPRSGAGGLNPAVKITKLLNDLGSAATLQDGRFIATQLMRELNLYCSGKASAGDKVDLCTAARDSLFKAKQAGVLDGFAFFEAMQLGADWFIKAFPFAQIAGTAQDISAFNKCAQTLESAGTLATLGDKRSASEEVGSISARYQMCALAGRDLYGSHFNPATAVGSTKYSVTRSNNQLLYARCAGPYNVNEILVVEVQGCDPIVIVAEAKGGGSTFGDANPHPTQSKPNVLAAGATTANRISQTDLAYAVSRAIYMSNAKSHNGSDVQKLRKEIGFLIQNAAFSKRLLYITARGQVKVISTNPFQADLTSEREHIKWI